MVRTKEAKRGRAGFFDYDGTMIGATAYFPNLDRTYQEVGFRYSPDLPPDKMKVFAEVYEKFWRQDPKSVIQPTVKEAINYIRSEGIAAVVWTAEFPDIVVRSLEREGLRVDRIESTFGTRVISDNGVEERVDFEKQKDKAALLRETQYIPEIVAGDRPSDLSAALDSRREDIGLFVAIARSEMEKDKFRKLIAEKGPKFRVEISEKLEILNSLLLANARK